MTAASGTHKPRIVIVGAGAAGALSALHLAREAGRRSTAVEIILLDPADRWARGTAFGTGDDQHLLNVPASGMSALPEDPTHFVAWRRRNGGSSDGYVFAPRREWARYLDETLTEAVRQAGGEVSVEHRRVRAVGVRRHTCGAALTTSDGEEIGVEHLPDDIRGAHLDVGVPSPSGGPLALSLAVEFFEREYILRALALAGGKRAKAAELLGISRKHLWHKMRIHAISEADLPS